MTNVCTKPNAKEQCKKKKEYDYNKSIQRVFDVLEKSVTDKKRETEHLRDAIMQVLYLDFFVK